MSENNMPCRSCRLLQLEPEVGILPLPVTAPPPVKRTPALPPVVLRVMPLRGSPAPIGYIFDATLDPNGGLLAAALAFFSHQGHQVVHDPCPDLGAYCRPLGVGAIIIPANNLPNHILLLGLDLLESLFAPSPVDVLGTFFMAAYPSPALGISASVGGPLTSGSVGGPRSASPFVGGTTVSGQPMGGTSRTFSCGPPMGGASVVAQAFGGPPFGGMSIPRDVGDSPSGLGGVPLPPALAHFTGLPGQPMGGPFLGAFSRATFDSAPALSLAASTPSLPAPSSSSIARSSPVVHAYWSLHSAPGDFPPCPPSGVEPLHHPDPVKEVFLNESPSRSHRSSLSSWTGRSRASPPVVISGQFERRDWLSEDGYKGGRLLSSNSMAGHRGPGSSLSQSSTYPHGAGSNSDDYERLDWGSSADDESFWAPPTPLVPLPQDGAHRPTPPGGHSAPTPLVGPMTPTPPGGLSDPTAMVGPAAPGGPPPLPSPGPRLDIPIPLPVDRFTLPPIKSGGDYLRSHGLILFWLRTPGFSTALDD
jgi:hypothetical protein